ncbi:MAG: hypothetical protein H7249_03610 [Chitinophagaceae bacterium]|nr:hypothetical protein [Oligoflexus sp.]
MKARLTYLFILTLLGTSLAFGKTTKALRTKSTPPLPARKPTADEIVRNFTFVGDFDTKEETRNNSKEIFWRYPSTVPKVSFDIKLEHNPEKLKEFYPVTVGEGRAIEHLNTGRMLFLEGKYEEARQTWLSGRARFGKTYPYHRRNDYFIASAFLYKSYDYWLAHGKKYSLPELRQDFINGNAFISAAFDKKKDLPDAALDKVAPSVYYNQAVVLYNYERYAGVVGAATLGLDFLRKTGRSEYRRDFHRMLAETYIRNSDYLEAVREIDMTLRQDQDIPTSAALFARVGDIYYALNNFELAEEVYEAANRIDAEKRQISPNQYALRGESLFWMGRFEEARKNFQYALQSMSSPRAGEVLDDNMQALASLRIADTYLAEHNMEKAKLAYFTHSQEFRGHVTENFAKIRLACLELPYYDGNNIAHTRALLAELKDQLDRIPSVAQEMAWTCETASYGQHDRNPEMVERIRRFAALYPESGLLKTLVEPVRDVQSTAIDAYFNAGDAYGAVLFFEKTRKALYPKISDDLARKLFASYVNIHQSEKAEPFIKAYEGSNPSLDGKLRLAVAYAEIAASKPMKERAEWFKRLKAINDAFLKEGSFFDRQPEVTLSIDRIMATPGRDVFLPWVFKQALRWSEDDISVGCDRVYPLLQTLSENKSIPADILDAADVFIDKHLKNLLRFETQCAYSLMDFESTHSKLTKADLIDKYLKRDYIQMDKATAPIYFNLAEQALKEGEIGPARKIWTLIVAKADPKLPEVRFAKARLDTRQTELENLWKK